MGWLEDGRLGIGDKLPSEDELRRWYKVTNGTVRIVMIRLAAQGLIWGEHGRGVVREEAAPSPTRPTATLSP